MSKQIFKKKIVPQDFKRSFELIIRDNPNLTGKEILAEQKYDEACYDLWKKLKNKKLQETIDWLNQKKYFKISYPSKGSFGLMLYLEIKKAQLIPGTFEDEIYVDVIETSLSQTSKTKQINIETLQIKTFYNWSTFDCVKGDENIKTLTKIQYQKLLNSIENLFLL